MNEQEQSIAATIAAVFKIADDAARSRKRIGEILSNVAPGRDTAALSRMHSVISDIVTAFGHMRHQIAAIDIAAAQS